MFEKLLQSFSHVKFSPSVQDFPVCSQLVLKVKKHITSCNYTNEALFNIFKYKYVFKLK